MAATTVVLSRDSKPGPPEPLDGTARLRPGERRGRGALSNARGRFEAQQRVVLDDGWGGLDGEARGRRTTITPDASRTVISRNSSPDIGFDRSLNPYRGCEHGCTYCYARPSHAYLGLSPGLDFETRIMAKFKAPELLRRELSKPGYRPATLIIGANTDAYQPAERNLGITRKCLEVLAEFNHPIGIVTKSHLVTRDLDILSAMAEKGLVKVFISVTTLDPKLARAMEPRAATPARRLETIRRLADAAIPVGVMAAPMIPGLTDMELESILTAASRAGARQAGYILLRLPLEIAGLFSEWLAEAVPNRAARVLSLMKSARGGKLNDSRFGSRMKGQGPIADILYRRFQVTCKRLALSGLDRGWRRGLEHGTYDPPADPGDVARLFRQPGRGNQLSLF